MLLPQLLYSATSANTILILQLSNHNKNTCFGKSSQTRVARRWALPRYQHGCACNITARGRLVLSK